MLVDLDQLDTEFLHSAVAVLQRSRGKFDVIVPVSSTESRAAQPVLILANGIGEALELPAADSVSARRPTTQLEGVTGTRRRKELLAGIIRSEKHRLEKGVFSCSMICTDPALR